MPRFFPRFLPFNFRRIKPQRTFPVLFISFIAPSDRHNHTTPLRSSSFVIPSIPLPDTSRLQEALLTVLPTWTTNSATSTFVRRPQADIVVGITLEREHLLVAVTYFPKGEELVIRSSEDDEEEDSWVDLRQPNILFVNNWTPEQSYNHDDGHDVVQDSRSVYSQSTIRYTTSHPHRPIGLSHQWEESLSRYDPDRDWFLITLEDFLFSDDHPVFNPASKPPTFALSKREVMTDFARQLREHVESFIASEVLNDAMIVNETPVIKYLVAYPDVLDGMIDGRRNLMIAFKDAGFPMLTDDIDIPFADKFAEEDEFILKDIETSYQMIEFFSVGFTGLIGYANLLPSRPQLPSIQKERPFITVVDDEVYFTSRLCLLTNDSRFGVVQDPLCRILRSPIHRYLVDEHATLIIKMFADDPEGADDIREWRRILEEHPGLEEKIDLYEITNWDENPALDDVIDVLRRRLDKNFVELEAEPQPPPRGDRLPHKISASCIAFARMVDVAIRLPILDDLEEAFMVNPSMTDIAIFARPGSSEVYKALFDMIYILKSLPKTKWVKTSRASPGFTFPDFSGLSSDGLPPVTELTGEFWGKHWYETPDYEKFLKKYDEDHEHQATVSQDLLELVKYLATERQPVDLDKYYQLRTFAASDHGLSAVVGMCEAVSSEIARIFAEALRV
ncbi:hypothetical protein ABW21_db0202283 [Orbilia brochopaga]|nr:hypothetical protein ABW21_db0202283 [Drechslerella brochopaga]